MSWLSWFEYVEYSLSLDNMVSNASTLILLTKHKTLSEIKIKERLWQPCVDVSYLELYLFTLFIYAGCTSQRLL